VSSEGILPISPSLVKKFLWAGEKSGIPDYFLLNQRLSSGMPEQASIRRKGGSGTAPTDFSLPAPADRRF